MKTLAGPRMGWPFCELLPARERRTQPRRSFLVATPPQRGTEPPRALLTLLRYECPDSVESPFKVLNLKLPTPSSSVALEDEVGAEVF